MENKRTPPNVTRMFRAILVLGLCILLLNIIVIVMSVLYFEFFFIPFIVVVGALDIVFFYLYKNVYAPVKWLDGIVASDQVNYDKLEKELTHYPMFSFISKLLSRRQETADRRHKEELSKKQAEFRGLQSQINPHFLYNTLESIRGQALIDGVPEIANMAKTLSSFFRYNISASQSLVQLSEEIRNIQNYFVIQKYRFGSKLSMEVTYGQQDEDCQDNLIPKLTLQPIIENAIFHGLETSMRPGHLQIKTSATQSRMLIVVSDNGVGMEPDQVVRLNRKLDRCLTEAEQETANEHAGIALANVNKRIKLCFGEEYGMNIRSIIGMGTDVEIVIPAIKKMDWDIS